MKRTVLESVFTLFQGFGFIGYWVLSLIIFFRLLREWFASPTSIYELLITLVPRVFITLFATPTFWYLVTLFLAGIIGRVILKLKPSAFAAALVALVIITFLTPSQLVPSQIGVYLLSLFSIFGIAFAFSQGMTLSTKSYVRVFGWITTFLVVAVAAVSGFVFSTASSRTGVPAQAYVARNNMSSPYDVMVALDAVQYSASVEIQGNELIRIEEICSASDNVCNLFIEQVTLDYVASFLELPVPVGQQDWTETQTPDGLTVYETEVTGNLSLTLMRTASGDVSLTAMRN